MEKEQPAIEPWPHDDVRHLIYRIDDLIEQAAVEKSHYYTASVLKEIKHAISGLLEQVEEAKRVLEELAKE